MMETGTVKSATETQLLRRNAILDAFFDVEGSRLAEACGEMSRRFLQGGRLLAFGQGSSTTDAQHVAVEFVHPVIVGKRALPAMDLGLDFEARLPLLVQSTDMVMGFASSTDDAEPVVRSINYAQSRGAMTFALSGRAGDYAFAAPDDDPLVCQEIFEVLYHLLWETVHVYFERRQQGHDIGASSFLYPFLGKERQFVEDVFEQALASMRQKVGEVNMLRTSAAQTESSKLDVIAGNVASRLDGGGKVVVFGNGGSATDANDFATDCMMPPTGLKPIQSISLSDEPATITAIANDIGAEAIFVRQLIAHGRPADIALGISTSGSSGNIISALAEARRLGMYTVALVGYDGGRIVGEELADASLIVRSDYIPRIQEVQASLYHVLRRGIDRRLNAGG